MTVTLDELEQMVVDVTVGNPPPKDEDDEHKAARARIAAQVADIIAKGGVVEIPSSVE